MKFSPVHLALAAMLALGASSALAGTITGTVTGTDGKPAAGVQVRLQKAKATGDTAKAGAKKLAKTGAAAEKPAKPAKAGAMTAVTSADGSYKFENVADGNYTVVANGKALGTGKAEVTVSGDTPATVAITLEPKAPAKKK
jgi:protocatechuate 3,4-dioxygenase beta subunit